MFKGTYRYRIDAKGRVPVPPPFRPALQAGGGRAVVTLVDQCLAVYAPDEWARLEAQLRALPAFSPKARALTRLLMSRAADVELDVQGRILLPPGLRAGAALADEAVVVGVLDRFELWPPAVWDGFLRDSERLLDDVSLDVAWPGIGVAPVPPPPAPAPPAARPAKRSRR